MKTLDEVIAYFDNQTQQRHVYLTEDAEDIYNDALHYLKEYQRYQSTPSRNGHMSLVDYFEASQKNEPLTWDELRTMEGKPVWVELLGKGRWKGWDVIGGFDDDEFGKAMVTVRGDDYYLDDLSKTWQAYPKERKA